MPSQQRISPSWNIGIANEHHARMVKGNGTMQESWEIEQKYVVTEPSKLRMALEQAGFRESGEETQTDVYFRHPCRDFRARDEAFRLRAMGKQACVTYKGPRLPGKVKTRPETELVIEPDEFDRWQGLLQQLGFTPLPAVTKTRTTFAPSRDDYRDLLVTLDCVDRLGTFAEIELIVTDQSLFTEAQAKIQRLGETLGLTTTESRSYLSQLLALLEIE